MGWINAVGQVARDALGFPRPPQVHVVQRPLTFSYQPVVDAIAVAGFKTGSRVSRDQALEVAAVQRARNQICSVATLPLRLYQDLVVVETALFRQFDPDVPNVVHMSATIEDLLFEGIAWWEVTARMVDGYPMAVRHLPVGCVSLAPPAGSRPGTLPSGVDPGRPAGPQVWIDGVARPASDVIRFDSPNPGLLKACGPAIARARLLDKMARLYADNPRPLDYFTDSDDPSTEPPEDEDLDAILGQWATQRRLRATAKVPTGLQYHEGNSISAADLQLVELQRQVTLEIANGCGVDPEDLGLSTTSRTYFNAQDRRISKVNETYAPMMAAITDRLSMGDVTKRGYAPRFDLTDYLKADALTQAQVAQTLISAGIGEPDDFRPWFGLTGPAPSAPVDTAPEGAPAVAASTRPGQTLSATFAASTHFTAPSTARFAVDQETRTIRGLAVPYGVPGTKYGTKYVFSEPGSVTQPESGRVKHFIDHGQPIGVVTEWSDTPAGLEVALSVMPGDDGDRLLAGAAAGVFDGLSAGIDWSASDPQLSRRGDTITFSARHPAVVREISTTAMPVFDTARVTSVAASHTRTGDTMNCEHCGAPLTAGVTHTCTPPTVTPPTVTPADPGQSTRTFSHAEVQAMLSTFRPADQPAVDGPTAVDPTRRPAPAATMVSEPLPYRFSRRARNGEFVFASGQEHVFSGDLLDMSRANDVDGHRTEAGRRVMALLRATFADIDSADINETTPNINRPDLYTDVPDYKRPIWDLIGRGTPPNSIQPFTFPKFSSASGLVAAHTEGVEPASGTFVTTSQTVTPTGLSGKANITREVWDMGGNPAVSSLIFNKMVQGYWEAIESAAATFLNTLTAATDIALTAGYIDTDLTNQLEDSLAGLQFVRGYDFRAMVVEQVLFGKLAGAVDDSGRKVYPMLGPTNANGTAAERYRSLNIAGYSALPAWALSSTPGSSNNSWIFDPSVVFGWATAPQRLEFPGADTSGAYAPVAEIGLGIWGYKAFANSDIAGVRQLTYDSTL